MDALGLEPRKIKGRRYTDEQTLAVVVQVLLEQVNTSIVEQLCGFGSRAVGLHSGTLQCLFGEKLQLRGEDGKCVDLGRVGRVTRVDRELIDRFCAAGVVPVIPSLAWDTERNWLNINADTAGAAVAAQVKAEKLVFLTDTPGILRDRSDETSLLRKLNPAQCRELMARGIIDAGMIPKVEACLESLQAGVRQVHMIDGRIRHSLLLEIYTDKGVGTEIRDE